MLTAIRIDPIRFGPDFRADLDLQVYAKYGLPAMLDVIADLVEISGPAMLALETGRYVMWMLPGPEDQ